MSSIRPLEKPKGCLKVIAYLKEFQPVNVSDIIRSTGLSQDGVYSCLDRLTELEILEPMEDRIRGKPRICSLTRWGNWLGSVVLALVDTFRDISGKYDVDRYLAMPVGSLSTLVYIHQNGSVSPKSAVSKAGLSTSSANSALKELRNLELVNHRVRRKNRKTLKVYELTNAGRRPARLLDIIDIALRWKGNL